jgi:hypothetical protein
MRAWTRTSMRRNFLLKTLVVFSPKSMTYLWASAGVISEYKNEYEDAY